MDILERYGYPALVLIVLLEGVGVPTPAVSAIVASSVAAGTGRMNLVTVAVATFLAAVVGDNLGYALGRYAGRRAVLRWGRYVRLTEHRLERAEDFIGRKGANLVIVARFIDGLRQTNGIIAGAMGMPWRAYAIRDAIGAVLWTTTWVTIGYLAGDNLDAIRRYQWFVIAAVAAVVVVALWYVWRRRRAADGRGSSR